jgi:hypothetical protein
MCDYNYSAATWASMKNMNKTYGKIGLAVNLKSKQQEFIKDELADISTIMQ